jgi:hypothetical protein
MSYLGEYNSKLIKCIFSTQFSITTIICKFVKNKIPNKKSIAVIENWVEKLFLFKKHFFVRKNPSETLNS